MKIVTRSRFITSVRHVRYFERTSCPGAGFVFDCSEDGLVDTSAMSTSMRASYDACVAGTHDGDVMLDRGVERLEHTYRDPAVGLCNRCSSEVVLGNFTNTCALCGADYNSSGQELAPREQWGEETGEQWWECY